MLHLDRVEKKEILGKISLRSLAYQKPDYTWAIITDKNSAFSGEAILEASFVNTFTQGVLVLVDIADNREILSGGGAGLLNLSIVIKYCGEPAPTKLKII